MKPKAAISWSGGKDGYLAFRRVRAQFDFTTLITMFDEQAARSRSHGLRPEIIERQAQLLNLQPVVGRASWPTYTDEFVRVLHEARASGVTEVVFGDIFGDQHRDWTEAVCTRAGLRAHLPLWAQPTREILDEFLATGAEARIVTVNSKWLDESWLGRALSAEMLAEFTRLGVDPCGENGEYHTLVTLAPEFAAPLSLNACGQVVRDGCFALDYALGTTRDV